MPEIKFDLSQGKVLDFIFYDKSSNTFKFNEAILELLLSQGGNIGFFFNIGEKKIGKSFLFSLALDLNFNKKFFKMGQRGIKIWSKPLYREEDNLSVYFVDV